MLTLKLAFRNVLRNKRRTTLTIMTMSGGMLLLIFALSTVEGSYDHLIKQFTADGIGHIQIVDSNYLKDNKQTDYFQFDLEKLNTNKLDIEHYSSRVESFALIYGSDKSYPAGLLGVDWQKETKISRLDERISQGIWPTATEIDTGEKYAVISQSLADRLGLALSEEVAVIGQAINGSIATELFTVIGILDLESGGEANLILTSIADMRRFLELPANAQHRIIGLGHHYDESHRMARMINQSLPPSIVAEPWQTVEYEFFKTMEADKEGNQITLLVIMVMVALGVLNTLLMATMERTKEYGVLRSIGTTPFRLALLIVCEALVMAMMGAAIAILLAIPLIYFLVSVGIPYPEPIDIAGFTFTHIKGSFAPEIFLTPTILLIGASLLVSLIPAVRVVKLTPVEAMNQ